MSIPDTPARFVAKWKPVTLPERAASQEHFIDLCRLLGQPTPAERDATGAEYTFEKGVKVTGPASVGSKGESGYADVWWRGRFGWEYKRKDKYKDLAEAYRQLCQYREALENPPLLIVCDIARTEIHTNFTGTRKEVHVIRLEEIAHPDSLAKLRRVFTDPHSFKPTLSTYHLTENTAAEFAKIADQLRQRGHDPHTAAHFLMKCMFCLFAEDVKLLPKDLFSTLLKSAKSDPASLTARLNELFDAMRTGGHFGVENIDHFDGGLFDKAPALPLKTYDIHTMLIAGEFDWGSVEPSIFGTLFERSLDPSKRSQIGAHYTSREDIMLIVEPVVMAPLRREWEQVKEQVDKQLARRNKARTDATKRKANDKIADLLQGYQHRLASIRILDPACGSGNFLYVAIQELLSLEKEVIVYAASPEIGLGLFPLVRPTQLHGIEINPYAAELAQVVIWIGYLQWMRDNGFIPPGDPILAPLTTIECRDAILDFTIPSKAQAATWPKADFIIGNPPFLGSKLFRQYGLPDDYIEAMYGCYELPNTSDLCCYWFELARHAIEKHKHTRAGLLGTQGIRGGDNRRVLERIKKTGDIFMAWSDRPWILDGAAVHVSMVGFDAGLKEERTLDGTVCGCVNADLTGALDVGQARVLEENERIAFMGTTKGGPFEVDWSVARTSLRAPNPVEHPNTEVLVPWINGSDLTKRDRGMWIIDFGAELTIDVAAGYEAPFALLERRVKSNRTQIRDSGPAHRWWLHNRPRPDMREAISSLRRFLVTTRVSKHRLFRWYTRPTLPDSATFAFARSDDYFLAVLHSSIHELWARRMGTQLREAESGFRYTPTTCFETFPLPWPPGTEPRPSASGPQAEPRPSASGPAERGNGGESRPVEGGSECGRPLTDGRGSDRGRPLADGRSSDRGRPLADGRGSDRGIPLADGRGSDRGIPLADGRGSDPGRDSELHQRISKAAAELNEQRERWLNPPEWIESLARLIDARDDFADVPEEARSLIRHSAIMAEAARDPRLRKRTLTNLYNERPTWLRLAHEKLDRAVLAAYAAVDLTGEWSEDWAEVWVETGAGQPLPEDHPLADRRKETDQRVLANLLRLNLERAAG